MTAGLIENIESRRKKMDELAFSAKGRQLVNKFEKLNFLREALICELEKVGDECELAMYEYSKYIGLEISPERLTRILSIKNKKENENVQEKKSV